MGNPNPWMQFMSGLGSLLGFGAGTPSAGGAPSFALTPQMTQAIGAAGMDPSNVAGYMPTMGDRGLAGIGMIPGAAGQPGVGPSATAPPSAMPQAQGPAGLSAAMGLAGQFLRPQAMPQMPQPHPAPAFQPPQWKGPNPLAGGAMGAAGMPGSPSAGISGPVMGGMDPRSLAALLMARGGF